MTIRWRLLAASELPQGDGWLGAEERKVLAGLRFPEEASLTGDSDGSWRSVPCLHVVGVDDLNRIHILAAEDGAPEAWIDGQRLDSEISISHRDGLAACAISPDAGVGCDLEAVEPRSSRFVNDFFTERERRVVGTTADAHRDRVVALTWSAKESALKVLRVGLRRDTRSVEVEIDDVDAVETGWHRLRAGISPEGRLLRGWWRQEGETVLTIVSDEEAESSSAPASGEPEPSPPRRS